MKYQILQGSNLDVLPKLADNSVDAVITDPPYELGFMGKKWDNSGIAYNVAVWQHCKRVLKPGGHLLSFGGTRTFHRLAVAIEDAGFEIRDSIAWLYSSGFPKSHNLKGEFDGWGTALKPAFEPIVVARKPLDGTVAANAAQWGTGAINISDSRIGSETITTTSGKGFAGSFEGGINNNGGSTHQGRWPANIMLDETTAALLDEQSGFSKSTGVINRWKDGAKPFGGGAGHAYESVQGVADSGGASRFFYVAKANKKDRSEGIDLVNTHPTVKPTKLMQYLVKLVTPVGGIVLDPFAGSGSTGKAAILEGFSFIGIELTAEYVPIIEARLQHAQQIYDSKLT
jgi:DNA modification methylase